MRRGLVRGCAAVLLSTLLPGATMRAAQPQTSPSVTLPSITAEALDKTKLHLPAEFKSPFNLILISFDNDQKTDVDSWIAAAKQTPAKFPGMQVWALPVAAHENSIYRWWLNSSMRSSADPAMLRFTVPLYLNKARFRHTLQIDSEKQPTVLLADKDGHVLWRSSGGAGDEKRASLVAYLKGATAR